ncbi:insulinase family protein [Verrucomicrobiaceae bacterium R5-34]|nr:insulinase family protein [Verrucomicrobiaceae bacterium R5-34]
MRKFAAMLILLLVVLPQLHAAPKLIHDIDAMQVRVYQLDNGLTVYLTRNAETPRLYAEIAVRAGSSTDPADCTGLAHYLEHLMFKGSSKMGTLDYSKERPYLEKITRLYEQHFVETDAAKRKEIYQKINRTSTEAAKYAVANDIDRIYKFIGGTNVNAHTYYEETIYKVDLPANQLERWATIESERFSDPVFRLFHTELEAVYEEKNTSLDSGARMISEAVERLLFPGHTYGSQTVLGLPEHLKKPSLVRIRDYFQKYYVPGNMAIIISGDIEMDETIAVIDRYFGPWPAKPVPQVKAQPLRAIDGIQRVTVQHEGEEFVTLAWQTVPNQHPDAEALMIFDMILDNSVAGLINLNLVSPQKVRSAGSYLNQLNEAGAQYLWGSPRDGQALEDVEAMLLNQIRLIQQGKFEDWLIPAIITNLQSVTESSYETNENRVAMIRDSFIARQPWAEAIQDHARLAAVTREDVVRVANQYFGQNYVVGYLVKGKADIQHIEKPPIDAVPLNSSSESAFARSVLALPTTPLSPRFMQEGKDYQQSGPINGVTYYTTRNPVNDLFSITWTFPKGSLHDDLLLTAFDLLGKSGTTQLSSTELGKQWYQLGVSADFYVNENFTEITLSGLASSYEPGMKLLWQWLHDSQFQEATLKKLVADLKISRAEAMEEPGTIIHAMARYHRYGKQSKYLKRTSSEQLDQLSVETLKSSLAQLLTLPHDISYVGKLNESQWREKTPVLKPTAKVPAELNRPVQPIQEPVEILFYHREMAQAQVWIESKLDGLSPDDLVLLNVFNEYFGGGMSSVVFQELREARGLAYSASGYLSSPRWVGDHYLAVGSIACQADKTEKALTKFLQLFDQLPESDVRFKETRDALIARLRAERNDFRNRVSTVQFWQRRGVDFDLSQRAYQQVPSTQLKELLEFYRQHVKSRPKRISILGDRSRVDLDALKKIGPVRELVAEDIFTR